MEECAEERYTCPYCGFTWIPRVPLPNYCAGCKKPISEEAKAKARESRIRYYLIYALRKVKDVEKFKELWMSGATNTQIARELGIHPCLVYFAARALNLPKKPRRPRTLNPEWREKIAQRMRELHQRRREEAERRVLEWLGENGGYCLYKEARKALPCYVIRRLFYKGRVFKVRFIRYQRIFKEEYRCKTFLCAGRDAVVRLLINALKKPENKGDKKLLTKFLKLYLTEAERLAVMEKLGAGSRKNAQKEEGTEETPI